MVSIVHSTPIVGVDNPHKQVSKNVWNEEHTLTGTPGQLLGLDGSGNLTEVDPGTVGGSTVITPQQFGAVGDGVTDDSAAFLAMIAYAQDESLIPYVGWIARGSPRIFIPVGTYNLGSTPLDLNATTIFEGDSTMSGYASRLKWTGETNDGIRVQAYNTSGTSTIDGPHATGAGSNIRNLALLGPNDDQTNYTGNTEGEHHAIRVRCGVNLEDLYIDGWNGDGIHAVTSVGGGGSEEGNSNCSFISRVRVTNVRNGLFLDGADANAWVIQGVIGTYCRRWTVYDSSFLGNTHIGHHSANSGLIPGSIPTQVSHGGRIYSVKHGQEVGASTNAPSGTATDNTWWLHIGVGAAVPTLNINNWLSGTTYRSGGSFCADSANAYNTFIGCYVEGGDGPAQFPYAATMVVGGLFGGRDPVMAGNRYAGGVLQAPNGVSLGKTIVADISGSSNFNGAIDILHVHNNSALTNSVYVKQTFSQGFEADGVTPCKLASIGAFTAGTNPATNEAVLAFGIREYSTGLMQPRVYLDGPGLGFEPADNNFLNLGQAGLRWKTVYGVAGNFSGAITASNISGTNTGDQTSIVGISGTKAQFNTACSDGDFLFVGDVAGLTDGNKGDITLSSSGTVWTLNNSVITLAKMADVATGTVFYRKTAGAGAPEVQTLATLKTDLGLTGTNSGDQTSIVGITGTKAQFDTACTDGNFLYVGDVTAYTDEMAQDAIGAMIDSTLTYVDATPSLSVNQTNLKPKQSFVIACSDETTALTTGTAKVTFRMPYAFTVTEVRASLTTAQTSGSIFTVDINESGTTIISTKLTIDNTEKTSTTAATAAVISDSSLADDAEITIDIDQVGDGTAKGLKVTLIGNRT